MDVMKVVVFLPSGFAIQTGKKSSYYNDFDRKNRQWNDIFDNKIVIKKNIVTFVS
jgi:hypothetical protein